MLHLLTYCIACDLIMSHDAYLDYYLCFMYIHNIYSFTGLSTHSSLDAKQCLGMHDLFILDGFVPCVNTPNETDWIGLVRFNGTAFSAGSTPELLQLKPPDNGSKHSLIRGSSSVDAVRKHTVITQHCIVLQPPYPSNNIF